MKLIKTTLLATCATLLFSSSLAMAKDLPKATIQINSESKTLVGSEGNTTRDTTWHYGNVDDVIVFSSNISIANQSNDIVYTNIEFKGMNIYDSAFILPGRAVDNITTNFSFRAVHIVLRDSYHAVFFDGYVYPNSHFTITPVDTHIVLGARAEKGAKPKLQLVRN